MKSVSSILCPWREVPHFVIDAPWATALSRGGRACPYATMSQQQLLDLPIPKWL